jgi:hypothetical protein
MPLVAAVAYINKLKYSRGSPRLGTGRMRSSGRCSVGVASAIATARLKALHGPELLVPFLTD